MKHLDYKPLDRAHIPDLQRLTQETGISPRFYGVSKSAHVALLDDRPVGFIVGTRGSDEDEGHILDITATYLVPAHDTPHNRLELAVHFIAAAADKEGVTHYRLNEFQTPLLIHDAIQLAATTSPLAPAPVNEDDGSDDFHHDYPLRPLLSRSYEI